VDLGCNTHTNTQYLREPENQGAKNMRKGREKEKKIIKEIEKG